MSTLNAAVKQSQ